ncbi:tetratricopeptide repeat protein [Bacillus sp. SCS-151]|uniref:tetratricopeptide repeat protein n=1 Tax=Nanhaiella sioensis TaxID=3115293 RepID=UPI00397A1FD6
MMNFGRLIYYHRKRTGLTQQQLVEGICSVSHLSKIENNSTEMSKETMHLLCERLNIQLSEEKHHINRIEKDIKSLNKALTSLNIQKSQMIYTNIIEKKEWIESTTLVFLFNIVIFRYYLFFNELSKAQHIKALLMKQEKKFSQHERILYDLFVSIYYHKKNNPKKSLDILKKIQQIEQDPPSEVYYYLSLSYGKLNKYSLSMLYGEKALEKFQKDNNYLRIIDTQLVIAINLKQTGAFDEALEIYLTLIDKAELLNSNRHLAKIYHNMGNLYFLKKEYHKASQYFKKSLEIKEFGSEDYIITLSGLSESYIYLNEREVARELINRTIELSIKKDLTTNVMVFTIYSHQLNNNCEEMYKYIESYALPFFLKNKKWQLVSKYGELMASYYSEIKYHQKAYKYLSLSNEALHNIFNKERGY